MTRFRVVPKVAADVMTARARLYLGVVAFYGIGIAIGCLLQPERFGSSSFNLVKDAVPGGLFTWAVIHFSLAFVAIKAAWRGDENWARGALIFAAAAVGMWNANFTINYFIEGTAAPTAPVVYTTMMFTHIIQARLPIRSPFEPVLTTVTDE